MADGYISDDEQWEKVKAWWQANGTFIIAGLVIGLAIIGGWRWWEHNQAQQQVAASALYTQFEQVLNQPDAKQGAADAVAKNLITNYSGTPYAAQAALGLAAQEVAANKPDQAAEHLQWVVDNASDDSLARLARLRLARVQIANKQPKAALATLSAVKPGGFEALYAEVRGDAWRALDDPAKAHAAYQAALTAHTDEMGDTTLLELKLRGTASAAQPANNGKS
ncbi:MAG TPA: tetratricopeptide repeat protein [Gammaproteobacteria bacterium]|nr:tetratricopeptide repeat protein [Gammaproteobacteria bacterium]